MAYESLKEAVWEANRAIVDAGLVVLTWGNASAVDRENGVMAIKPSGVDYERLRPEDIVVVSLETGQPLEHGLKPSSDTPTHRLLYVEFDAIGGVVHTHSRHAVSWAQAEREIPCLGTTHADHFNGPVPVTRRMRDEEIRQEYEKNTGALIVERLREDGLDPMEVPAVLVAGHGPFVWGGSVVDAVENAIALEAVAGLALDTYRIDASARPISEILLEKHFRRKHGAGATYGQRT